MDIKDIDNLLDLKHGWDSYKAPPINPKCINIAKDIAEKLLGYEWQAVPTCDGGIQLESHTMIEDIEISIYMPVVIVTIKDTP